MTDTSKEAVQETAIRWRGLCAPEVAELIEALAAERDAAVARAEKAEEEADSLGRTCTSLVRQNSRLLSRVTELESIASKRAMYRRLCEFRKRMNEAETRVAELEGALTPSAETKAAHIGEFTFLEDYFDVDGEERRRKITVPWTTIKEIMAAIRDYAALSAPPAPATQAAADVIAERRRQIEVEGWTPEHDDEHVNGELALAAACYASHCALDMDGPDISVRAFGMLWPDEWDVEWFKPSSPRRDLVKAGALIIAEIERLDRLTGSGEGE